MDVQLIKILCIALPGIIGFFMYSNIVNRSEEYKEIHDCLLIFVFSIVPYIFVDFIKGGGLLQKWLEPMSKEEIVIVNIPFVFEVTIYGIVFSIVCALVHEKEVVKWTLYKLRLTKSRSNKSVWDLFHTERNKYYCIKDHKYGFEYIGWIKNYSEKAVLREIVIGDAKVYKEGKFVYLKEEIYICRQPDEITIEDKIKKTVKKYKIKLRRA